MLWVAGSQGFRFYMNSNTIALIHLRSCLVIARSLFAKCVKLFATHSYAALLSPFL